MSKKKIKIAIIGLGNISLGFDLSSRKNEIFTHTKAILLDSRFELVGGVDPNKNKRSAFEKFSKKPSYPDIKSLYAQKDVEAVVIATPSCAHAANVNEIVKKNPRGILLEKPLSVSFKESTKIYHQLLKNKIKTHVNYVRLSDPGIIKLTSDIKKKKFGYLQHGRIIYSKGLLNNASHYISLIISIFGIPKDVIALGKARKSIAIQDIDVDFILQYKNFSIICQCIDEKHYSIGEIDLFFSKGRIRFTDFTAQAEVSRVEADPDFPELSCIKKDLSPVIFGRSQYQKHSLDQFYRLLSSKSSNWSLDNAFETMKICEYVKIKSR